MRLVRSVLNGLKSAIERITINEDHQLNYEGFPYVFSEVDFAFSFDRIDHLQYSRQVDQVGLFGRLFRRRSYQSSGSSQT